MNLQHAYKILSMWGGVYALVVYRGDEMNRYTQVVDVNLYSPSPNLDAYNVVTDIFSPYYNKHTI